MFSAGEMWTLESEPGGGAMFPYKLLAFSPPVYIFGNIFESGLVIVRSCETV